VSGPELVPDTKDWTWVLERRCADCGFDAPTFDRELVGSMILTNAASWQRVLRGHDVGRRPRADVWSPLEYACHVRDVFRVYDERLALMLAEDDPRYANWDQDATAIAQRYAEQDPLVVADELVAAAARLAERFDSVHGAQWTRRGTRSDGARFTVDSFARYMIHDPIHHLWDVGRG
jgi:DinB superfamily